jgi:hypothetical protein
MGGDVAEAPEERVAAAVARLSASGVAVDVSVHGPATRYEATRPAYHVLVHVDPSRFIGLEFDLLDSDGSVRLHYFVDTGRYDVSQPRHAWYLSAMATDVVLFLEALGGGGLLAKVEPRRAAVIVPTAAGLLMVRRGRVWTSAGRYRKDAQTAGRDGFQPV